VGSKTFTESVVLGEMVTLLARAAGTPAEHRRSLGGTRLVWDALLAGESTSTPSTPARSSRRSCARPGPLAPALARARPRPLRPAGLQQHLRLGMREEVAARLGIATISDLAAHPSCAWASATSS
jgi:osmoprotectant transport system permease protein